MAVVDANYCFTYVDVGTQGRISDGGVFGQCHFKTKLDNGELQLPAARDLPGTKELTPFVFVADDAFPLLPHFMKPFPGLHVKGSHERVYNGRLSRPRIIVENVFGIVSVVFRILRKPILLEPSKAAKVVLTCTLLHNYMRKKDSCDSYNPPGTFNIDQFGEIVPGVWRSEGMPNGTLLKLKKVARKTSTIAKKN
uniref:DDE Tnp4 domain-containing protein n=1 Tax=Clastoptera arizonana TaxID=38151 RepID=A0A1B6C7R5_9HEMI